MRWRRGPIPGPTGTRTMFLLTLPTSPRPLQALPRAASLLSGAAWAIGWAMGGGAQGGMHLTAVTALKLLRLAAGLDRPALGPAQALAAISPAQAAALRAGATQVLRSVAGMPIDMQQIGALRGIPGVAEILGGGKTTGPVDTAILPERPDPVNVGMEYEGPPVVTTETPAIRVPSATPPPTFKERIGTWRSAPSQAEWRRQRRQAAPIPGAGGVWGAQTGKAFGQLGGGRGGFAEGGTITDTTLDLASIMRRMGLPYTPEQRRIAAGGGVESGANILPSLVAARTGQGLPAFQAFGGPMSLPEFGIGNIPTPFGAASSYWRMARTG